MNIAIQKSKELQLIIQETMLMFATISAHQWNEKASANKWSKKELLGHLIDSASNNLRRFVVGQYEQNTRIVYQQDDWVAMQDYQSASAEDLQVLWKLINEQIIRVWDIIPESRLANTSVREQAYTLAYFIEDYIVHLNHHLDQFKPQHNDERN